MPEKSEKLKDSRSSMEARDSSLDIIRIAAFLCILGIHFYYKSGFYGVELRGKRAYVCTLCWTFFLSGVPMFLLLSGYLLNWKKPTVRYYTGLLKTLFMYVLAGIFCQLYIRPATFREAVKSFLLFEAAPYGWYVEMYVGLYLLIPFLNIAYHALPEKKYKLGLILSLAILTSLPGLFNMDHKLLPAYWLKFYPVTFYFVGAYLSEYPPKMKKRWLFLLLAVQFLLYGSSVFWKDHGSVVSWQWTCFEDLRNLITAVLLFSLLQSIRTEKWNPKLKKFLKYISGLTFGAFLVSWVFDTIVYTWARGHITNMCVRFEYMFLLIPLVAVCSLLVSAVLNLINRPLLKGAGWCAEKIQSAFRKHRKKEPVK